MPASTSRPSRPLSRRAALGSLAGLAGVALLGACSSGSSTAATSAAASGSSSASPATVSIALSWTPNTDYTGLYVAQSLGYFADQNLTVKIVPYATTSPETLVSKGRADFGFSYQAGLVYARAAGQDLVSVFAPDQKGTYAIGVRADRSDITSPKDLDGKTYAGFGTPDEGPELQYVIKHAGGTGTFKTVTLSTSAYEAVYAGKADFTIPVVTWEGVQAELAGKPLKTFKFTDFGFPEQYSVLIASSQTYLAAHPEVAKRFLAAVTQGYAYAADHPDEAAALLVKANPTVLTNADLVKRSQNLLVSGGYLKDADGNVGTQSADVWKTYGEFLYSNGLLTDANGAKLTAEPDWSTYYTQAYLPAAAK